MRIGIDCRALQEPFPSGVSIYAFESIDAILRLPESAAHTFVLFFNGFHLAQSSRIAALRRLWHNMPVEWHVKNVPNKVLTAAQSISAFPSMRWMFGDVDVVYVPNVQFFPWRDRTIPFVMTIHDLSFERYPECFSMKGRMRHRLIQPRRMSNAASALVTVSSHTAADVRTLYGMPSKKIHVVYPGMQQHTPAVALEPPPSIPDRYILSLATIEPRKNIDALLTAFLAVRAQHPDLSLVFIGHSGWKSSHTIARMKTLPGVVYLGYVDDATKQYALQHAQLCIYPSLYEGFGFPPLEAQRASVPVIVGNHSSLPEVLGNSALFVDVRDPSSLVLGITHLLQDAALREELVARGDDNVKRFVWEKSARSLLRILEQNAVQ